jgi:hypothetical protein
VIHRINDHGEDLVRIGQRDLLVLDELVATHSCDLEMMTHVGRRFLVKLRICFTYSDA